MKFDLKIWATIFQQRHDSKQSLFNPHLHIELAKTIKMPRVHFYGRLSTADLRKLPKMDCQLNILPNNQTAKSINYTPHLFIY